MVKKLLLFVVLVSVGALAALDYTLPQLQELALSKDPRLVRLQAEKDVFVTNAKRRMDDYGPQLQLSYYQYFEELFGDEEPVGSTKSKMRALLRQDLIRLLGVRPKIKAIKRLQAAEYDAVLATRKDEVLRDLYDSYYDLCLAARQLDTYTRLQGLYLATYETAKHKYYYGEILRDEFMQEQNRYTDIATNLNSQRIEYQNRHQALCHRLGLDPATTTIDLKPESKDLPPERVLFGSLQNYIPQLELSDNKRQQDTYQVSADAYSSISLYVYGSYNYWQDFDGSNREAPEAGVQFSIPFMRLFSPGVGSTMRQQVNRQYMADSTMVKNQAVQQFVSYYKKALESRNAALTAAAARGTKAENLRIIEQRLSKRLSDFSQTRADSVEAYRALLQEELRLNLANLDKQKSLARLAVLCGVALDSFPTATADTYERIETLRALWVWNSDEELNTQPKVEQILDYCANWGINQLNVSFSKQAMQALYNNGWMSSFIVKAHQHNILVYAMLAENTWLKPDRRYRLGEQLQTILVYNKQARPLAKVDGIHLDLEPNGLEMWQEDKQTALTYLKDTAQYAKQELNGQLPLESALFVFLEQYDDKLLRQLFKNVDGLTLMAYQKNLTRLLDAVYNELAAGERYGKPVTIGLDIKNFKDIDELHTNLNLMRKKFGLFQSFQGFAFHDWDNVKKLVGAEHGFTKIK